MALLSFDTPLRAGDIISIRPLSPPQPVWLLTGLMDSNVVVKAEPKGEKRSSSFDQVAQVMSIVSPGTRKTAALAPYEFIEFKRWVDFMRNTDDHSDDDKTETLFRLNTELNNPQRVFVKMETLRLMNLEDGNDKASKKIGKVLNGPRGLEDMGKIIAADMFNCNNDRFNFTRPNNLASGIKWGPKKKQLNYLINPGNFMIREDGNQATLVGMDSYCNSSVIEHSQPVPNDWIYSIFHPSRRIESVDIIAERCAYDLRKVIGKTTGFIIRERLDKNASARVAAGMIEGANAIEQFFRLKFGRPGVMVPLGFQSRAEVAGWTWFRGGITTKDLIGNLGRSRRN